MKKYILLTAAAAMGLWACQNELEKVTLVDPSRVVAPVLHELPEEITITKDNMSEEVVFEWEKADFGQNIQYSYTIFGSTDDGTTLVPLYSNISGATSVSASYEKFNQLVTTDSKKGGLGLAAGMPTEVSFYVGATVGSNYQTFYSAARKSVVTATAAEREYAMVWLPGAANGWNHKQAQHLYCYAEDNNTFVGVTDFGEKFAENQFKLTGAADWSSATGNWGMADPEAAEESAEITLKNDSNDNITVYKSARYYSFTFTKKDLKLKKNASFDKVGIIGLNGDWNTDIDMVQNPKQIFYADIDVAAATEFKFRLNGAWDTNWGGELEALENGGDNIPVEPGKYRVYLNLNDWDAPTARLDASMYGKDEPGGGDEPEPEPEPVEVKGWNIIGLNGDWDNDVLAREMDGVWTAYITAKDATEFKWRKDAGWDEDFGGVMTAFGEAFDAVPGGSNIALPEAGFYKVVLDLSNAEAPKITIWNEFTVWGLIGVNGDWDNDIFMFENDGKWVSPSTAIEGEFKIRENGGWTNNRGGIFASVGVAFDAVPGGDNINVPAGEYVVTYDPATETITVAGAVPENQWALIGVAGDWENDIYMKELASGVWVSPVQEFSGGFKLRFNNGWDVNRGGAFEAAGKPFSVTHDGSNITLPEGKWQIVYNPMMETVTVNSCIDAWSVIGTFEGADWNWDLYMSNKGDGIWESESILVQGGVKLRFNGGWDVNMGGEFIADEEAFDAVSGGDNISATANTLYKIVYDSNASTITFIHPWCLIGNVNGTSWDKEIPMTETSAGVWECSATLGAEFKIRKSGGWEVNRGGTFASVGVAFDAVPGGDNIKVSEPNKAYKVVYNQDAETMTITAL